MKKVILTAMAIAGVSAFSLELKGQSICDPGVAIFLGDGSLIDIDLMHKIIDNQDDPINPIGVTELDEGLRVKNNANLDSVESKQVYAVKIEGAVHIGDGYAYDVDDDNPDGLDKASVEALEDAKLFVEGGVATESMTYLFRDEWVNWPDYVFEEGYVLHDLDDLDEFISSHKHLPGVITQQEVKKYGVNDKQMNVTLLEKIEELTLYTISQNTELQELEGLNVKLLKSLEDLQERVNILSRNL